MNICLTPGKRSRTVNFYKIWLDDLRPAPYGFVWCRSVNEAKRAIEEAEKSASVELIDCDHDLGDYVHDGGDGIKLLDWLAERGMFYLIPDGNKTNLI